VWAGPEGLSGYSWRLHVGARHEEMGSFGVFPPTLPPKEKYARDGDANALAWF